MCIKHRKYRQKWTLGWARCDYSWQRTWLWKMETNSHYSWYRGVEGVRHETLQFSWRPSKRQDAQKLLQLSWTICSHVYQLCQVEAWMEVPKVQNDLVLWAEPGGCWSMWLFEACVVWWQSSNDLRAQNVQLQAGEGSKWYMFDPVSWERKEAQPQATWRVAWDWSDEGDDSNFGATLQDAGESRGHSSISCPAEQDQAGACYSLEAGTGYEGSPSAHIVDLLGTQKRVGTDPSPVETPSSAAVQAGRRAHEIDQKEVDRSRLCKALCNIHLVNDNAQCFVNAVYPTVMRMHLMWPQFGELGTDHSNFSCHSDAWHWLTSLPSQPSYATIGVCSMATVERGKGHYTAGLWWIPAIFLGAGLQQTRFIDHQQEIQSCRWSGHCWNKWCACFHFIALWFVGWPLHSNKKFKIYLTTGITPMVWFKPWNWPHISYAFRFVGFWTRATLTDLHSILETCECTCRASLTTGWTEVGITIVQLQSSTIMVTWNGSFMMTIADQWCGLFYLNGSYMISPIYGWFEVISISNESNRPADPPSQETVLATVLAQLRDPWQFWWCLAIRYWNSLVRFLHIGSWISVSSFCCASGFLHPRSIHLFHWRIQDWHQWYHLASLEWEQMVTFSSLVDFC